MALAVREVERRFPPATIPHAVDLLAALAQGLALAEAAHASARALALDQLGNIDLPDATPATADDQAQVRAIAAMYLAAQIEETGLLSTVETLSGIAVSGAVQVDLGSAAGLIETFWQQRNERFRENERRAFYTRLFGEHPGDATASSGGRAVSNEAFENLMIDLGESLYKLDENALSADYGSPHAQNRLVVAARNLAENLLNNGGGMTAFAAHEILNTIQSAVRILQQHAVQHAFGTSSMWTAVRAIASRYLHLDRDTSSFVARGKSGLVLLSWLADVLPHINDAHPLITLDHPAIGAATEWLEASLAIREAGAQTGG